MGLLAGTNRVCSGGQGAPLPLEAESDRADADLVKPSARSSGLGGVVPRCIDWRYWTMLSTFPGLDDLVITVVTPAETPSLAATILVLMPPVPSDEPALETSDSQWQENIRDKDMILTISLEG